MGIDFKLIPDTYKRKEVRNYVILDYSSYPVFGELAMSVLENSIIFAIFPTIYSIAEVLIGNDNRQAFEKGDAKIQLKYIEEAYKASLDFVEKIAKKKHIPELSYCTEREFFMNVLLKLRPWQVYANSCIFKFEHSEEVLEIASKYPKELASIKAGNNLCNIYYYPGEKKSLDPTLQKLSNILDKKVSE